MIPRPRRAAAVHGRDAEIAMIVRAVRRGSHRCVSITGPVGIGRSRVLEAVRTALETADLRVCFEDDVAPRASLVRRMRRDVLVVSSVVGLGLDGELEVPLGGLDVPADDTPGRARVSAAVAMLADAAKIDASAARPDTLAALARLARASDGHPAVLEQIAGWLGILSPEDALRAFDEGSLPTVDTRLAARLRKIIGALSPGAREALAALAETSAPFDLEVARAAVDPKRGAHLPRSLASLVTAGLLLRVGAEGEQRWYLPRPFRALVRGPERARARRRLTAHYARLAAPLLDGPVLVTPHELRTARAEVVAAWEDARRRAVAEEVPLAVALATLAWNGDPAVAAHAERIRTTVERYPDGAQLHVSLGELLWLSGDLAGADAAFVAAVDLAARQPAVEAIARIRRALIAPDLGGVGAAWEQLRVATELARSVELQLVLELALNARGQLLRAEGDVAGALAAFEEEAELARHIGSPVAIARSEAAAADCRLVLGQTSLARLGYERALRAVRRSYPGWASTFDGYIGLAAWEGGAFHDATRHCRRALAGELSRRYRIVFGAARAAALAELGDVMRGAKVLARCEMLLEPDDAAATRDAVHASRLLLDLARAREEASRTVARSRIEEHLATRAKVVGDEERAFVRALERVVGRGRAPVDGTADLALDGRPQLEKVLAVLRAAQGKAVRATTLFRAVWPDDVDVAPKKAEARVRKAISLLRDLGLRGALVTSEHGYALRA